MVPLHCFQIVVFHNSSKIFVVLCGSVSLISTINILSLPRLDLLKQRLLLCKHVTEHKVKAREIKIQQIVAQQKMSFIGKAGKLNAEFIHVLCHTKKVKCLKFYSAASKAI